MKSRRKELTLWPLQLPNALQENFSDREEAWDLRARRSSGALASVSGVELDRSVIAAYEDAITALPTPRMFDLYAAFLLAQVGKNLALPSCQKPFA